MGKCPNCGHRGIFLPRFNCKNCDKQICDKCGKYLLQIATYSNSLPLWYACSEQCTSAFVSNITKHISPNEIDINEEITEETISPLVIRAIFNSDNKEWLSDENEKKVKKLKNDVSKERWFYLRPLYGDSFWNKIEKFASTTKARNLMKARRFEEAAKIYEEMKMYEKAGKIRAKGEEVRVKRVEVSVDLNSLLRQVKDGGLVVIYRCPQCRAPVKISKDTNIESLRACEYCGAEIEAVDIADLLKSALS